MPLRTVICQCGIEYPTRQPKTLRCKSCRREAEIERLPKKTPEQRKRTDIRRRPCQCGRPRYERGKCGDCKTRKVLLTRFEERLVINVPQDGPMYGFRDALLSRFQSNLMSAPAPRPCSRCGLVLNLRKNGLCIPCDNTRCRTYMASPRGKRKKSEWKARNIDKVRLAVSQQKYRRKCNLGGFTFERWQSVVAEQESCCAECGLACKLTVDHIIPLSKGGTNFIWNIQGLCHDCNTKKSARLTFGEVVLVSRRREGLSWLNTTPDGQDVLRRIAETVWPANRPMKLTDSIDSPYRDTVRWS